MSAFLREKERVELSAVDETVARKLADELSIPYAIARVLAARNLNSFNECKAFFRPDLGDMHDPFLFEHMEKAVTRIVKAIEGSEKIVIYGDYDVDGITATALMVRVLKKLGAQCSYYLPNRLTEGYGISEDGIRCLAEQGATLIITVDCGIGSEKEITLASCLGIDCIITDHHEMHGPAPDACAVLDPKDPTCTYPFKVLAGVGVALKLCQALAKRCNTGNELWEPYLDIVALGTAADIVPMINENRIITFAGFQQMSTTIHKGLKALIDLLGLTGKVISTSQVVFQLAPCINAVGRLGDPGVGVELLLTDDDERASELALRLRNANLERRELDRAVAQDAIRWVEENTDGSKDLVIVAGSKEWHAGVIGIVASKMVERYNRPSILLSIGKDGYARGSGRSIPALNLLEALNKCASVLEGYGGHFAAAGMTIKTENIERFRVLFNEAVRGMITSDDCKPVVIADAEVTIPALTPKFYRIVKQMEPFGPGNMRPVFLSRQVRKCASPRLVGSIHVKLSLASEGIIMDAIAFNFLDRLKELKAADTLTVAYTLDQNEWNGKTTLQMKVKGIEI